VGGDPVAVAGLLHEEELPPPPQPPQKPVRIGGAVKQPKLVNRLPPAYPPVAVSARVQGVVVLEAVVGPDGHVQDVRVLRSIPLLDQAAMDAVRRWEYEPLLVQGQAVPFVLTVTVAFTLAT
jgi:protein TonB